MCYNACNKRCYTQFLTNLSLHTSNHTNITPVIPNPKNQSRLVVNYVITPVTPKSQDSVSSVSLPFRVNLLLVLHCLSTQSFRYFKVPSPSIHNQLTNVLTKESSLRTIIGSLFSRMANQIKRMLLLFLCVSAQIIMFAFLVMQGMAIGELYDLRNNYDEHSESDLQNRIAITNAIDLFISAMFFGSLGQFFAWTGLLYLKENPGLLLSSNLFYVVYVLCNFISAFYSSNALWLLTLFAFCFSFLTSVPLLEPSRNKEFSKIKELV